MSDTIPPAIEPETTLAALLAGHPELEPVLCDLLPMFGKLKPGFFRDTVARTTTLEQAAVTGHLRLPDLIMKLRQAAGLPAEAENTNAPGMPLWAREGKVKSTLDARAMLAQGQHPKGEVLREISNLSHQEVFVLLTPFVPAPLIELARSQGALTWTRQGERGVVETYFSKGQ